MLKNLKIILPAIGLVIIVAGIFFFKNAKSEPFSVKRGDIFEAVYGIGTVKSNKIYELKFGVANTVKDLFVREGENVKLNQVLASFDIGTLIKAPFSGTITHLPFHKGENVLPQGIVLRMEDLDDLSVEVTLEQQGALRIKKGQPAKLSLESLRGTIVHGVVESIFPKENQFIVAIKSEKFPAGVLPGMTADVSIEVGKKENALLIPVAAISNGHVTRLRDNKKQKIEIEVGIIDGDWAEILSGDLKVDDSVIAPPKR